MLTVTDVREIPLGQTDHAGAALLELRPHWGSVEAVVAFVDAELRPAGYRLAGVFEATTSDAVSVVGFREVRSTAWGHHLYIDDLATVPAARGRGHADALLQWTIALARQIGCASVQLDSGVGAERAAAHRLYLRNHLRISAHHFSCEL